MRGLTALVLATLASTLSVSASAQDDDAQRFYMRGAAAYGNGDFDEAAALFERAYELSGDAPLLYNLGLAREQAGDTARAIAAYERFLEAVPDAPERTEVERSLATLRRHLALELERAAPIEPVTPAPPVAEARRSPEAAPWIVAGIGAAGLLAGAVVGGLAQSDYDAARGEPEHRRAGELERSANDLGAVANVLFVAGGVVAAAGVVWGIVDVSTLGPVRAEVAFGPGSVSFRGTF